MLKGERSFFKQQTIEADWKHYNKNNCALKLAPYLRTNIEYKDWFKYNIQSCFKDITIERRGMSTSSTTYYKLITDFYDLHENFYQYLLHLDQLKEFFHDLVTLTDHIGQD
ncbi:hypothetical protein BpHYR1_003892 [Brachionus plicatilis]|uniref:Uncharacterized protein n=1 Tax=Brachionus plicatilis TaxID=10195 RepID=A0A3M7QQI7_BRAPC|nr:hypothetical protein BpHYR1_003892 [Brachionus plicatilis]